MRLEPHANTHPRLLSKATLGEDAPVANPAPPAKPVSRAKATQTPGPVEKPRAPTAAQAKPAISLLFLVNFMVERR